MSELLVVMIILGIVLAGMTGLFVSASNSQVDQSNRHRAQEQARLALDALRREIRCASGVPAVSSSSLTITLPGGCQKPVTTAAAPFTWCVVGTSAPYALWRYSGSTCGGTGRRVAESLQSNAVFSYNRTTTLAPPTLVNSATGGVLGSPAVYSYVVTAVDSAGRETSGALAQRTVTTTSATNVLTISWTNQAGAVAYNVYGRDDGSTTPEGLRLLGTCPSSPACATATSFVDDGSIVPSSAAQSPPLGVVSISLAFDLTPGTTMQRFRLSDDIVLRNSGRT